MFRHIIFLCVKLHFIVHISRKKCVVYNVVCYPKTVGSFEPSHQCTIVALISVSLIFNFCHFTSDTLSFPAAICVSSAYVSSLKMF